MTYTGFFDKNMYMWVWWRVRVAHISTSLCDHKMNNFILAVRVDTHKTETLIHIQSYKTFAKQLCIWLNVCVYALVCVFVCRFKSWLFDSINSYHNMI